MWFNFIKKQKFTFIITLNILGILAAVIFLSQIKPILTPQKNNEVLGINATNNKYGSFIKILTYHYIRDFNNPADKAGDALSVSPSNFDRQMQELSSLGYKTVTYADISESVSKGKSLPNNSLMVTFDDGHDNQFTQALPILEKYHFKASFGIIIGFVGQPRYMNWEQIKLLKASGHEIVSHTISHKNLSKINQTDLESELKNSKKLLDNALNQDTNVIVYPYGGYNQQVITTARNVGYQLGRTTHNGTFVNNNSLLEMPSQNVLNHTSFALTPKTIVQVPIDRTSPKGSISCPQFTNDLNVNISLNATDDDNSPETLKMQLSEDNNFTNVPFENIVTTKSIKLSSGAGLKKIYARFVDPSANYSSVYSCESNLDMIPPVIKNFTLANSKDSINVSFEIDKPSFGSIEYGNDTHYGKSIQIPYVKNDKYEIKISNLLSCTLYHFRINLYDKFKNNLQFKDNVAMTLGCLGNSNVENLTSTTVYTKGGTVSNSTKINPVILKIPENSIKNETNFQINDLDTKSVIGTLGAPSGTQLLTEQIIELKAIANGNESIHTFDKSINVSMHYKNIDFKSINKSSIKIYRWDNGIWKALDNCLVDENAQIVECSTNNFSIFSLFGHKQDLIDGIQSTTKIKNVKPLITLYLISIPLCGLIIFLLIRNKINLHFKIK